MEYRHGIQNVTNNVRLIPVSNGYILHAILSFVA